MDFDVIKKLVEDYFNGQYEVNKFLGEGSFAEVYLVNHHYLDDLRAMKIIKEPLGSASNTKKVFHEVMLATRLRHKNIISIYDAGVISTIGTDADTRFLLQQSNGLNHDNWAYFIMEYVQGGDLEKYLKSFINSNISMPISRVLDIVRQILLGLNTLHSSNPAIVHRDLKPNNILLSYNSKGEIVIKISDFGFAKEVSAATVDVDVAGNKNYMAPECYSKVFSTKTDIYAVGVIFYQILTGHCPYNINKFSLLDVMDRKPWNQQLKNPSYYRQEIPDYIDNVVLKCLAVDPSRRYGDAMDLLHDVEYCIDRYKKDVNERLPDEVDDAQELYSQYIINDSIRNAFEIAKCENRLNEAIEILEREMLEDYDIRRCYSHILRVWKSERPDVKLVSQAFSVNLKGNNYKLSCNYLKEAMAYNPSIKGKYLPYIELWNIFSDLRKYGNLIKSVLSLEDLMKANRDIHDAYINIIPILKTFSVDEILNESLRLAGLNSLADAANLMEFAVVGDRRIEAQYAYKLSLLKQNMKIDFKAPLALGRNTVNYAIDLGTTDSVIAYYNDGDTIIIPNRSTGENFTPSAVLIDENDNIEVGRKARDAIIENSHDAVSEFKDNMGFSIPYRFDSSSQIMLPEELSSEVLKDLRKSVYCELGENIEHVVITVPANSNPIKTKAVNDAADRAGFRSHYLLLEPIAVSMAYGLQNCENGKIWMIYDLGGATFNVTLLENNNGEIQKIDTIGVDTIGGNIFDWKIVDELMVPKIMDDLSFDDFTRDNPKYYRKFSQLKKAAENAKIELTKNDVADIYIEDFFDGYDFKFSLTVDAFSEIIEGSIKYSLKLCRHLLEGNLISPDVISKIILVGGSSLSPIIQEFISDEFSIDLESSIDSLTVVARGAAVYAGSLEKPSVEVELNTFSVALKSHKSGIVGRVFTDDDKFSFLGYDIEFSSSADTQRVPVDIDGVFKVDLESKGQYFINVYDNNDNLKEIDVKSPNSIIFISESYDFEMNIEFFDKNYDSKFYGDMECGDVVDSYNELINELNDLSQSYSFTELNEDYIIDYLSRLVSVLSDDKSVINQAAIYLKYVNSQLESWKTRLEVDILVEGIENKLSIIEKYDYFKTDSIRRDLSSAVEDCNLDRLNEIYDLLVEKYVVLKRNDVITACFFNLRYGGIYTKNMAMANGLIENAIIALNKMDYNLLYCIISQLYEIDERNWI